MALKSLNWLNAAIALAIGAFCTLWAEKAAADLGIQFVHPTGLTDFRATYGGMCLGMGAFFLAAARKEGFALGGAWLGAFVYTGLAATRAWGLYSGGLPQPMMVGFLIAEIILTAVSVWIASR